MATDRYIYSTEILKRLQNEEMSILQRFDEICVRHGLKYFAVFGTAIGAIRHHGFIPWDDDIDVGMMLDDYEKLINIPQSEWGDDLELVTATDECSYHLVVLARIYKKGTIFEREKRIKYDKTRGYPNHDLRPIWIDIFVYQYVPNIDCVNRLKHKMFKLQRLYWVAKCGMKINKEDTFSFKIRCLKNDIINKLLNVIPKPELIIYKRFYKIIDNLNHSGGPYITTFECDELNEMVGSCLKESEMFPLIRVPFENSFIYIQNNYHDLLTNLYGDYMSLPPENQRMNHGPAILDFGDGKGNVIKES